MLVFARALPCYSEFLAIGINYHSTEVSRETNVVI